MNLRSKGTAALIRRLAQSAAPVGPVVYTRLAGGDPVDLTGTAWVGRTVFRRDPAATTDGVTIEFGDRDYLIPVSELQQNGTPFEPARGDRVTETIDGVELVFEVVSQTEEPAWRYSDATRAVYRVHTKQARE